MLCGDTGRLLVDKVKEPEVLLVFGNPTVLRLLLTVPLSMAKPLWKHGPAGLQVTIPNARRCWEENWLMSTFGLCSHYACAHRHAHARTCTHICHKERHQGCSSY